MDNEIPLCSAGSYVELPTGRFVWVSTRAMYPSHQNAREAFEHVAAQRGADAWAVRFAAICATYRWG